MSRVRVSDIGKELGIETKAILAQLNKMGVAVKNHLSTISDTDANKLKNVLKSGQANDTKKPASKIFIRRKSTESFNDFDAAGSTEAQQDEIPQAESVSYNAEPEQAQAKQLNESHSLETSQPTLEVTETPKSTESVQTGVESSKLVQKIENTLTQDVQVQTLAPTEPSQEASVDKTITAPKIDVQSAELKETHAKSEPVQKTVQQSHKSFEVKSVQHAESSTKKSVEPLKTFKKPEYSAKTERTADFAQKPKPAGFQSATIIRRAPESVYQVNMTRNPQRSQQQDSQNRRPYSSDSRPTGNRPSFSSASPSYGASQNQQKSFVMSDSMAPSAAKDFSARSDKARGKEREKKRIEEEIRNNKSRAKGTRFYERDDFEDDFVNLADKDESLTENSAINVRTMVSNKRRKPMKRKDSRADTLSANPTKASKKIIRIDEHISVNDLALEMSIKSATVIKALIKLGVLATANKVLDFDTATLVANEFGFETQNVTVSLEDIISKNQNKIETEVQQDTRPPIITIMGHVDHGKTSLLDSLRKTNVVAGEAGGITQHIGAYQITYQGSKLTFLDTPGHEAFTEMRARGAKVTDIVILVVAADDGVMPQTVEAIAHSKAAGVPIIVAINKIDKPNVNLDRLYSELADKGVLSEEWGGDSMFVKVSAKTGEGLDKLIEAILLQSEILELKAVSSGFAEGVVIEAKRDKARGPVATVIVTKGLLKQQDSIVIGKTMGRVRAMHDDSGKLLKDANPGTPVELIGLNDVPDAGDLFYSVASDAIAREAVAYRLEKHRQAQLANQKSTSFNDLQALFAQQEVTEKVNELNLIIKADTHGSVEAIKASLQKLDTQKVKNKVILASVGAITETDVVLADASQAIIVGFNVRPDKIAAQRAEGKGVQMMFFNIIYELIDAVKVSMAGTLAPIQHDKIIGHAEIRNLFTVPKVGVIAGCMVTDGKITRPCRIRVIRDGIVGYTGSLGSLKRFKDDAKEVMHGFECGIGVENYNDLKVGDVLEAYVIEEVAAEL